MRLENKNQLSIKLTDKQKGDFAEHKAIEFWTLCGWEVFEGPSDSVCDRIVRSPDTGEMLSIQIKYISKDTSKVETFSTGSGTMKGGKRKRTNYAKHNIDYIMAVNPHTEQYYLYPKDYYENYSSLTPSRHPGVSIPTVEKTLEEIRKTRHKDHLATLDSVYHD